MLTCSMFERKHLHIFVRASHLSYLDPTTEFKFNKVKLHQKNEAVRTMANTMQHLHLDHCTYPIPHDKLEEEVKFITAALSHTGFKEIMRPRPSVVGLGMPNTRPVLWFVRCNEARPPIRDDPTDTDFRYHFAFAAGSRSQPPIDLLALSFYDYTISLCHRQVIKGEEDGKGVFQNLTRNTIRRQR